jgi:hypothetical protein
MTEGSAATAAAPIAVAPWWVRPGLDVDADGRLRIAGEDADALARAHGTPLFVYDRARYAENARRLQAAWGKAFPDGGPRLERICIAETPRNIFEVDADENQ